MSALIENEDAPSGMETGLLGLIAEEPVHGYRLEEKILLRRMAEWTEISRSSIYRVVSQLEKKGWIDSHLEHEGQGATRKKYNINDAGRAALARGVLHQLSARAKSPFQLGLAFLTEAPRLDVAQVLERRAAEMESRQTELDSVKLQHQEADVAARSSEGKRMCADLLFDYMEQHLMTEREFIARTLLLLREIRWETGPTQ